PSGRLSILAPHTVASTRISGRPSPPPSSQLGPGATWEIVHGRRSARLPQRRPGSALRAYPTLAGGHREQMRNSVFPFVDAPAASELKLDGREHVVEARRQMI